VNDIFPPGFTLLAISEAMRADQTANAIARRSQFLSLALYRWRILDGARRRRYAYTKAYADPASWQRVSDALDDFARIGRDDHVPIAVVVFPLLYDFRSYPFAAVHQQVCREVERIGLGCLDLYQAFARRDAAQLKLHEMDDTHPNHDGHRVAALTILGYLRDRGLVPGIRGPRRRQTTSGVDVSG